MSTFPKMAITSSPFLNGTQECVFIAIIRVGTTSSLLEGEFSLIFGNFDVKMTVPADHVIAATGECQNYSEVLTAEQLKRWNAVQKLTAIDVDAAKGALDRKK